MEWYGSGGGRKKTLPWHVVQRMKARMREAPIIQSENDKLQLQEQQEAEKLLAKVIKDKDQHNLSSSPEKKETDKKRRKNRRQRIFSLFTS